MHMQNDREGFSVAYFIILFFKNVKIHCALRGLAYW